MPPSAPPLFARRDALVGGLCLCCLPALPRRGATAAPLVLEEIAPGILVRRGVHEDASAANRDAIANVGVIVGRDSVMVVDPGGSLDDGEALRAAIRAMTDRPITHVVMSHAHPDHIFGAGAFVDDDPVFIGHEKLPAALARAGQYYRERLDEILGPGRAGPVVMPTRTVAGGTEVDLGGRQVTLAAHGLAHTDNDLTVLDIASGTLFAGDLLFCERVPSLDGSLKGWLAELELLKSRAATRAVPGHGPAAVAWPGASGDLERYLNVLLVETRAAIADNIGLDQAVATVGAGERGKWALFDAYHGRNVTKAYKELEWE
jgi:quinoprotein relay system zinc metallohydrolase 2